ncbi:ribosomal protein [Lithospermum erythrorhizon]|uniref:Ribosomal protein n=1 Tax=Lithospermum erythrorhizon TaxID=34254 RepID=A0AAV3RY49_LITER
MTAEKREKMKLYFQQAGVGSGVKFLATSSNGNGLSGSTSMIFRQHMATLGNEVESSSKGASVLPVDAAPRIKFKRLDKTSRHIMQILDKEAVKEVRDKREITEIKPGYIIQLKLYLRTEGVYQQIKGIVIARRNAGLNTTIRLRRMVAGVGIESLLPLYSPNIKEVKVLERKKVRRAKLYYLRDKMNEIRKLETLSPK